MPQDNKTRVFFFEPTKQRIDDALKFGNGEFIFDEHAARASIWSTQELTAEILESLERQSYDPDKDFIAVTGHFVPVSVMLSAVAGYYGRFKGLMFDGIAHRYVETILGTDESIF